LREHFFVRWIPFSAKRASVEKNFRTAFIAKIRRISFTLRPTAVSLFPPLISR
jgi:hypothetical protein